MTVTPKGFASALQVSAPTLHARISGIGGYRPRRGQAALALTDFGPSLGIPRDKKRPSGRISPLRAPRALVKRCALSKQGGEGCAL